mmetsp:Transcript_5280/g.18940  ORF Transcript_5280/g.18940 Transcript_5280/m.18940 type:complete len:242 (-) Transcript_5280:782-1507(-)
MPHYIQMCTRGTRIPTVWLCCASTATTLSGASRTWRLSCLCLSRGAKQAKPSTTSAATASLSSIATSCSACCTNADPSRTVSCASSVPRLALRLTTSSGLQRIHGKRSCCVRLLFATLTCRSRRYCRHGTNCGRSSSTEEATGASGWSTPMTSWPSSTPPDWPISTTWTHPRVSQSLLRITLTSGRLRLRFLPCGTRTCWWQCTAECSATFSSWSRALSSSRSCPATTSSTSGPIWRQEWA